MKITITLAAATLLAACSHGTVVRERPVTIRTPVIMPCAGQRPKRPVTLVEQTPGWDTMDHKQRDAATSAWALEWANYAVSLEAATGACP